MTKKPEARSIVLRILTVALFAAMSLPLAGYVYAAGNGNAVAATPTLIQVDVDGATFLNHKSQSLEAIGAALAELKPGSDVLIRADRKTPYKHVVLLVAYCQKYKLRVRIQSTSSISGPRQTASEDVQQAATGSASATSPVAAKQGAESENAANEGAVNDAAKASRDAAAPKADDKQQAREEAFARQMTNVVLDGGFTTRGRESQPPKRDRYVIAGVKKLKGTQWVVTARVQYNGKDVPISIPLEIRWAGDTPVMSLSNMFIPGLGTYSARVVFHGDQYAGVWSGGKHGGQMFGLIKKHKQAGKKQSKDNRKGE